MKLENVDFMTAVEILCKNCGMQMPSNADNEEMQRKKNERDRIMDEYAVKYPGYGFEKHKGYPTKAHYEAIKKLGPTDIHRKTFRLFKDKKEDLEPTLF